MKVRHQPSSSTGRSRFGAQLQEFRLRADWSVEGLAAVSAVSRATLYRWEQDESEPRMAELGRVLPHLHLTEDERVGLLNFLTAPRAARERRSEIDANASSLGLPQPPTAELWRALRLRSGITVDHLAVLLGVAPSTVSRWERGETHPAHVQREKLCRLLSARPEQHAVLVPLDAPIPAEPWSLQACEASLERLSSDVHVLRGEPADLWFLILERELWRHALRRPSARRLLRLAYTWHAEFLLWAGRKVEVGWRAGQALQLAEREEQLDSSVMQAVSLSAHAAAHGRRKPQWKSGVLVLERWIEGAVELGAAATVYRDLAEYHSHLKHFGTSRSLLALARREGAREHDPESERLADMIEGRTVLWSGDPRGALAFLHEDENPKPPLALYESVLWARTLIDLGERADASSRIERAYELAEEHRLEHLRSHIDQQANRL